MQLVLDGCQALTLVLFDGEEQCHNSKLLHTVNFNACNPSTANYQWQTCNNTINCCTKQQFGRAHAYGACPAESFEGLSLLTVTTVMPLSLQVADFGSARFATQEGYHFAEQHPPERAGEVLGSLETMTVHRALVYCT